MAFTTGQWKNIITGDVCDIDNAALVAENNDIALKNDKPESVVASSNRASEGKNLHDGGSLGLYGYRAVTATTQLIEDVSVGGDHLHNRLAIVCAVIRCDNTDGGYSASDVTPGGAHDDLIYQTLIFDMDSKGAASINGANNAGVSMMIGCFFVSEGSVNGSAGVPNNQQYISGNKISVSDSTVAAQDSIELYVDSTGDLRVIRNAEGDNKDKDLNLYIQFSPLMR
jgi:hypothetical protein